MRSKLEILQELSQQSTPSNTTWKASLLELLADLRDQQLGFLQHSAGSQTDLNLQLDQLRQRNAHLERQLADMEASLQSQKLVAINELTKGIAHNFNNILQGVSGNLYLALQEAPDTLLPFLQDADRSAERAAAMVKELQLFSGQGFYKTQQLPVDLSLLLEGLVDEFRKKIDQEVMVRFLAMPNLPPLLGDPNQLESAIQHLLDNARDALEEGKPDRPRIHIGLDTVDLPNPDLSPPDGQEPGTYLRLRLADNGIGMDHETSNRIFDPFFSTKDVDRGTGLGLSTTYGIAKQHKGWITCSSQPGQGALFTLYLPVLKQVPLDLAEERAILVVDDDEVVRRTVRRILENDGWRVLEAENGAEGLAVLERYPDDLGLILLDLAMPHMSGEQMLAQLRQIEPAPKVIIFTGFNARPQDFAGVEDVIQKPLDAPALVAKVRAALA